MHVGEQRKQLVILVVCRCHKVILFSWSKPFERMFSSGLAESLLSEVRLPNVEYDTLKIFMQLLYGANVQLSLRDTVALYCLADQYDVQAIREACANSCQGAATRVGSYAEILELVATCSAAASVAADQLATACMKVRSCFANGQVCTNVNTMRCTMYSSLLSV